MKQLLRKKIGLIFIILQFVVTLGLVGLVLFVDMLPEKYLLVIVLILIFILLYTFFSQMSKRFYILGRVLSGIFCVIICLAGAYMWKGYSTINDLADASVKVDELSAIVLQNDTAQTIDDAGNYKFGIIEVIGREYTDSMIKEVETDIGHSVSSVVFDDVNSLVNALYNKEVGVIIFNEAYHETVSDEHENFDKETKVLGNHKVETVVNVKEEKDNGQQEIGEKPFIMYLSGIDLYGEIAKTSRSDVNIVAVVNPKTAQILLINTPRDYYVPLSISKGVSDKLTHAGIYGVDVSIATLEMIYDIDIDYYVRVNFSGLTDIVDALGGVNVYSDTAFTSDWGPSFSAGYNKVTGKQALAFCRERHHFNDGDRQRGKNHQHMIEAILAKATSSSVLTNFADLMDSISGAFETNMKTKTITKYVKFQMDEMPKWNIQSVSVDGTCGREYTYSIRSRKVSVMYPNEDTIKEAKEDIQTILKGGKIKLKDSKDSVKKSGNGSTQKSSN